MNDRVVHGLIKALSKNEKLREFVRMLEPMEVVRTVAEKINLRPKDASKVAMGLMKNAYLEGMGYPGIETNKGYPTGGIASVNKVKHAPENETEDDFRAQALNQEGGTPMGKGGITPKWDIKRWHFPPDPQPQPQEWPFDDMTTAAMQTGKGVHRGHKRGLMASVHREGSGMRAPGTKSTVHVTPRNKLLPGDVHSNVAHRRGNPLNPDLRKRMPGGDGAGGGGIYSKSVHSTDNAMPASPNSRSWTSQGVPGWSKTPPGKEFDMPDEEPNPNVKPKAELRVEVEKEELPGNEVEFMKQPTVGARIPRWGAGNPDRPTPYRGYLRK